jgi:hypothetical protein
VKWSGSTASTMASLSALVQRDLGDRRGVLDSHRVGALFVALVASMAGLAGAIRISVLKMDQRLMAVTASLAWAWGARYESVRPDEQSRFDEWVFWGMQYSWVLVDGDFSCFLGRVLGWHDLLSLSCFVGVLWWFRIFWCMISYRTFDE